MNPKTSPYRCNVRLDGPLGARLDAMISRNVAAKDVEALVAPFQDKSETHGLWQTEFWGKWMHAAVPLAAYSRNTALQDAIARGVGLVLASQEPDGYIGNYPDALRFGDGWDVWGIKYTLMGLMHYYDCVEERRTKDEGQAPSATDVLEACRRLCDCVIAELGPCGRRGRELWETGNWAGLASSSILEPVIWLYRRTGENKYLDFATDIVRGMIEPESGPRLVDLALRGVSVADRDGYGNKPDDTGEYVCKHSRVKAYEMMSCCQGLLEWCEAVRDVAPPSSGIGARLLYTPDEISRAVLLSAEDIAREEITLAGGASCVEHWFHGARKQHLPYTRLQETCVTITWMRLCQKLLRMTGNPRWADLIERAFHNAYLAALRPDGSEFASYTPLSGNRWHGMHHCFTHGDCCDANGPRGFVCYLEEFFRTEGDTAVLNFYASARVDGILPATGARVSFELYSLYPRTGAARIVCRSAGDFALRLRIPGWCREDAAVTVNGEAIPSPAVPGSYCEIRRQWHPGDIVDVSFAMPVVAHVQDYHVAFTRGPVLLVRDSRFGDGDLSEAFHTDRRYGGGVADGEIRDTFAPVRVPADDFGMAFSAALPVGAHYSNPEGALPARVSFCDFASAGNTWRHADSYRSWLPIERGYRE